MRRHQVLLILGLSILIGGCTLPTGTATLADLEAGYSRAQDAIAHAESMGAEQHASDLLRLARNRLEKVRDNQAGASPGDVLSQYRYVETLAQRAATRSIQKRVEQVDEKLANQPSPQTSSAMDTEVKSRLDRVQQRLSELSEQVQEDRSGNQLKNTRGRLSSLEDTVTQIKDLRTKLASLGNRLKKATTEQLPQLRDRVRRNTSRLRSLCEEVRRLGKKVRGGSTTPVDGPGLVAHWPFDDTAPKGFRDVRGRTKSRSLGADLGTKGVFGGGALRLSGNRDFLAVAHDPVLNPTGESGFTVSAWFKTKNLNRTGHLLSKWDPEGSTGWSVSVSPTDVSFVMEGGTEPVRAYSGQSPVDGTWHHLAARYDPEQRAVTLFFDGQQVDRARTSTPVNPSGFLAMGGFAHKNKNFFRGFLDEVRFYNRSLSGSVIQDLADTASAVREICAARGSMDSYEVTPLTNDDTSSSALPEEGILAHWSLDDRGGTVVDSVEGLEGKRIGATPDRPGVRGRAFGFDGRDDWVTVPDQPRIAPKGGFTVSAWVRPETRKQQYVVDKGAASSPYSLFLTGNDLVFSVNTDEGSSQIRSNGYELDRWYHLVGTYDGEVMRLFRNGNLVSTSRVEGILRSNNRALTIGSRGDGSHFFGGRIDEVKIYAAARSASSIKSEHKRLGSSED